MFKFKPNLLFFLYIVLNNFKDEVGLCSSGKASVAEFMSDKNPFGEKSKNAYMFNGVNQNRIRELVDRNVPEVYDSRLKSLPKDDQKFYSNFFSDGNKTASFQDFIKMSQIIESILINSEKMKQKFSALEKRHTKKEIDDLFK